MQPNRKIRKGAARYHRHAARSTQTTTKRRRKTGCRRLFILLLFLAACFSLRQLWLSQTTPAEDNLAAPYQIAYNRTALARNCDDIQYIVIHDTANTAPGADAMHHYQFFNRENQASSADFFVDDTQILQVNDYYRYYTWHCGDGKGTNGITNQNSIGVEICVNRDGSYRKAVLNAEQLVKQLMQELQIDAACVVRHYDASGKCCPASMEQHDWRGWKQFQKVIQKNEKS